MDQDPRAEALRALARFLVTDNSVGDALLRVAEISIAALQGAEIAGIALLDDEGRSTTGVYTDEESPEIDKAQYATGNGPCLDAWRYGRVVRIDDMNLASNYPEFARTARDHNVLSTLSLPLRAGSASMGALNLYARAPSAFSAEDQAVAEDLAAAAAAVLANASAYWNAFELGENLAEAMRSRAVIEQAKGILMARSPELDADGAFDLLRRASQRENIKLRDVARRIVERRLPEGG
ncbi:MAG: GAF and ANTAR domain-containing protein [Acidimicrobiales bacterium]